MTREQQINDALKLVLEAAANGELEYRSYSLSTEKWAGWMPSDLGTYNEYRAKPAKPAEPREFWIDPTDFEVFVDQDGPPVPDAFKVREIIE